MGTRGRQPGLEERLDALAALRRTPEAPGTAEKLRQALADPSHLLAGKAAQLAGELGLEDLAEDLTAAFNRFLENPAETDKGCIAKTAVVKALLELEEPAVEVFLRGIRHVQMEPAWGGSVDTAIELRANSALGLAGTGSPRKIAELAPLLLDPGLPVRLAAAQAIASTGRAEAEPVLRLKVLMGDEEPEALAECLVGLLHLAPEPSLAFVEPFLDAPGASDLDSARREAAVLALGESRLEAAVPLLCRHWERVADRESRRLVLLALVASRRDAALEFLLSLVAQSPPRVAAEVLRALAVYRHDERIRGQIEEAVEKNPDREELRPRLKEELG